MSIFEFAATVAAGTISGAIVAYLPTRRRDHLESPRSGMVAGHGNRTHVDQSVHSSRVMVDNSTATTNYTGAQAQRSDSDGELFLAAIAAFVGVLAFLFAWPLALGALLGISVVTGVTYMRIGGDPRLHAEAERTMVVAHAVIAVAATVISVGLVFFAAAGGRGLVGIENKISAQFPGYSSSPVTRWNVLVHHAGAVFHILGLNGSMELLYQVVGLVFGALITALLVAKAAGAEAQLRQLAGRPTGWLRSRIASWAQGRPGPMDLGYTLLFGVIAVVMASGLPAHLLMSSANHPSPPKMSVPGRTVEPVLSARPATTSSQKRP